MKITWSRDEVEEIVKDYFSMLSQELEGNSYNKTDHRNELIPKLKNRTSMAIEFKHQNITAVLIEKGLPYINGYKPKGNSQNLINEVVDEFLSINPQIVNMIYTIAETGGKDYVAIEDFKVEEVLEHPPQYNKNISEPQNKSRTYKTTRINFAERDQANKALGDKGEFFVIKFEQKRLNNEQRSDLASKVHKIDGDGAGYDIQSFNADGSMRYIEVKTTNLGKNQSFFVSINEIEFSEDYSSQYYLYRVFNFKKSPKLFILQGSLRKIFNPQPIQFRIQFRQV